MQYCFFLLDKNKGPRQSKSKTNHGEDSSVNDIDKPCVSNGQSKGHPSHLKGREIGKLVLKYSN